MKSCLREEILQAYLDGELARKEAGTAAAHLAECAVCAARTREAQQTLLAIGSAIESELPQAIPTARLRARLESALAEKAAPKFTLTTLFHWKLAAVAAGLLLLLSAIALFRQPANKPQHNEQASIPMPASPSGHQALTPKPTELAAEHDPQNVQQPEQRKRRVSHQQHRHQLAEEEVVTQFFTLREGEDLAALESARMVRVELPGSALSEVGLPVNPEMANASVKADVLLGDDGLARAIRFVR